MLSYFRDYKTGQVFGITNLGKRDYKIGQLEGFQIEAVISNWVMRDYTPGQRFQIGARITNRCGTTNILPINLYHFWALISEFEIEN